VALFQYRCETCKKEAELIQELAQDHECKCGGVMKRRWTPFKVVVPFRDGYDPGLGEYFNTQRERDYYVEKNELRRIKC